MRKITRIGLAAGIAVAAITLVACGSSRVNTTTTPATQPVQTARTDTTPTRTPTAPAYALGSYRLTLTAVDGTQVIATFKLSRVISGNDQAKLAAALSAAGINSLFCPNFDRSRDGIVVGNLTVENLTPQFQPNLSFVFIEALSGEQFGNAYNCNRFDGDPVVFTPNIAAGAKTWGPRGIQFVIPNAFSPSAPTGDQAALRSGSIHAGAFVGNPPNGVWTLSNVDPALRYAGTGDFRFNFDQIGF